MIVLLGLGVAVAVVGATLLSEERSRHSRPPRPAMRFEVVAVAALLIGLGTAMAYAGIGA